MWMITLNILTLVCPGRITQRPCLTQCLNSSWVEGMGLIGIGSSMKEAKTNTDLGVQNVRVTTDAEAAGGFYPVTDKDLFDMEYWSLEQAKR